VLTGPLVTDPVSTSSYVKVTTFSYSTPPYHAQWLQFVIILPFVTGCTRKMYQVLLLNPL